MAMGIKSSAMRRGIAVVAIAPMTFVAHGAVAQEAGRANVIEEIVVTAQKRSESIQDVPISMQAFSGADLERASVNNLDGVAYRVPNVSINMTGSVRTPRIVLRGIFSEPNNGGIEQAIPATIDGVPQGRAATLITGLYDLDRIEVLRGPQGTLYGSNAIAGIINAYTKEPGPKFEGRLHGTVGNYGLYQVDGTLNVPVTDKVFVRGSAGKIQNSGYTKNINLGTKLNSTDNTSGRLAVKILPSDNLTVTLRGSGSQDDIAGVAFDIRTVGPGANTPARVGAAVDADPYDRQVLNDFQGYDHRKTFSASATVDLVVGGYTLTSISGLQGFTFNNYADSDYTNLAILNTGLTESQHQFTQELRVSSPADQALRFVAGLYYYHQGVTDYLLANLGRGASVLGIPAAILPQNFTIAYGTVKTNDYAAFGQATYRITDQFSVTAGLRYESVRKNMVYAQPRNAILGFAPFNLTPSAADDKASPQGSLEFRPNGDILVYAKVARGFKASGFNLSTNTQPNITYRPENLTSYEAGLKSTLLSKRLVFNADLFRYDYKDLQVNQLVANPGSVSTIQASNAAKARSQGIELELQAIPVEGLTLTAGYGYADSKYLSFPGATAAGADYSGNRMQFAPKHSLDLSGEYEFPVGALGTMYARVEYQYRSDAFGTPSNALNQLLDPVKLVNGRIGLRTEKGWEIAVWGKNLSNNNYATNITPNPFLASTSHALGPPRTFGADATLRF
jgi:iron complex outermembrane receptor protein